jgi:hypothetical protein
MNMTITAVEHRNVSGFSTSWVGHGIAAPQGEGFKVRLTVILSDNDANKARKDLLDGQPTSRPVMPEDVVFVGEIDE